MRLFLKTILWTLPLVPPSAALGDNDYPVWEFPILGSDHIGENCSLETNQVIAILEFSRDGEVLSLEFIKKSTIPIINSEAEENILGESPYSEFEDLSDDEAEKFRKVFMYYTIPCQATD